MNFVDRNRKSKVYLVKSKKPAGSLADDLDLLADQIRNLVLYPHPVTLYCDSCGKALTPTPTSGFILHGHDFRTGRVEFANSTIETGNEFSFGLRLSNHDLIKRSNAIGHLRMRPNSLFIPHPNTPASISGNSRRKNRTNGNANKTMSKRSTHWNSNHYPPKFNSDYNRLTRVGMRLPVIQETPFEDLNKNLRKEIFAYSDSEWI